MQLLEKILLKYKEDNNIKNEIAIKNNLSIKELEDLRKKYEIVFKIENLSYADFKILMENAIILF